jgi:hypothetical protein
MSGEKLREVLDGKPPNPDQVAKIHERSDKDGGPKSQHHTLGPGPNQASPGNHSHDGGNSASLLADTITGDFGDPATLLQLANSLKPLGLQVTAGSSGPLRTVTFTGSRSTQTAAVLQQVLQALTTLGATNSTTA